MFTFLLRPGDIIHIWTDSWIGKQICAAVGSIGSHDGIVLRAGPGVYVGDSIMAGGSVIRPFNEAYLDNLKRGIQRIAVLRPAAASEADGQRAAYEWQRKIAGRRYDWHAFPRLWIKAKLGDRWKKAAGLSWRWYCTEGVSTAWQTAGIDAWRNKSPTPRTTEKRLADGTLIDVTRQCLKPDALDYALDLSHAR